MARIFTKVQPWDAILQISLRAENSQPFICKTSVLLINNLLLLKNRKNYITPPFKLINKDRTSK